MAIVIDESGMREVETLPVTDAAVQFGALGFFETMRAERGQVHLFDWHMDRLEAALDFGRLRLPVEAEAIREGIERAMAGVGDDLLRVKVVAGPGGDWERQEMDGPARVTILAMPLDRSYRGAAIDRPPMSVEIFSDYRMPASGAFVGYKSTQCWPYREARRRSRSRGFDEALLLNERGDLVEASGFNLWWMKDETLFMPAPETGRLPGVFARWLESAATELDIPIEQAQSGPEALASADFVFLSNSLGEVMQVERMGGESLPLMKEQAMGRTLLEYVEATREARAADTRK